MGHSSIAVPIDHVPVVHEIETDSPQQSRSMTLLELVEAVSEVAETENEVLATVAYMLNSGRVRLSGSFRDTPPAKLCG